MIKINKDRGGDFHFIFFTKYDYEDDDEEYRAIEICGRVMKMECSYCGFVLDYPYVYLIVNLIKNGLLPKDFKPLCCSCMKCVNKE